ncbi:Cyclic nucleotide-binding domain-containing protein [Tumidithrix helvetica PCC 7403]|uniref:cyclic nucleotide-binding domain-containing protein n=1 Tax=Tumidithrix helvetica TaxID=3457545 RepID=UPI003C80FC56
MNNSLLLLGEFSEQDILWLQQFCQRIDLKAGEVLIQEGVPIEMLYFLLEGRLTVKVLSSNNHDRHRMLANLTPGEIIGEMSFIDRRPPSATVIANSEAVLLAIPHALLAQRTEEDIDFGRRFYRGLAYCLSNRLRLMNVSLPQAGIEVSGTVPSEFANSEVAAKLPVAQARLETLIASI